jgi:hypothetical protein
MEERTYFLYKGLKKPLVFKGLKGKYIYYAGGSFVGTMILGVILSKIIDVERLPTSEDQRLMQQNHQPQ